MNTDCEGCCESLKNHEVLSKEISEANKHIERLEAFIESIDAWDAFEEFDSE